MAKQLDDIFNLLQRIDESYRNYSLLNEIIEGNSPDFLTYDGERYDALHDRSAALLWHDGKWLADADTHRDIISLCKFGCEAWELEEFFDYDKRLEIEKELNSLWSSQNKEFQYPSRLYHAKKNAKEHGINYILISWDSLDENLIQSICTQFDIDRNSVAYVKYDV